MTDRLKDRRLENVEHKNPDRLKDWRLENVRHGFQMGDMVWGKVKSHPWWPGEIYDEAFASHGVCETKKEGSVLVAFYGDYSYSWFDPAELAPFDPHYKEKSKQTNAPNFVKAVDDAFYEVRKRAALGLACHCRNPSNFQRTNVQGFVKVDVCGYEPEALYSKEQIKMARDDFQPFEVLSFIKKLALSPRTNVRRDLKLTKNAARLLAYRAAVFEEFDETYAQAFGVQIRRLGNSVAVSSDEGKALTQAPVGLGSMIAEAPCKSKVCENPQKVNDPKKKNKNLSKRRDEQKGSRVCNFCKNSRAHVSQNRAPQVSPKPEVGAKHEADGILGKKVRALSPISTGKKAKDMDTRPVVAKVSSVNPRVSMREVDPPPEISTGFPYATSSCSTKLLKEPECAVVKFQHTGTQSMKFEAQGESKRSTKRVKVNDTEKKDRNLVLEKRASPGAMKPEVRGKKNAKGTLSAVSTEKEAVSVDTKPTVAKVDSFDEPTMLVMKFPHGARLPSISELKARFARFGPLDTSSTRIYWNSSTCRVVFLQKSDAESAYNYAASGNLFGDPNVSFRLVEILEADKESALDKVHPLGSTSTGKSASHEPRSTAFQQLPLHQSLPINSSLKQLNGGVTSTGASTEDQQVKNMSSVYESDRGVQSYIDGIESIDQFVDAINMKYLQFKEKNSHNNQTATASTSGVDISSQMLSLLTRCSEIVADMKRSSKQ